MFMLIIWLQGIWLPEHGYSFAATPLHAGILMLPLTCGFLIAGPLSGFLSDRYGARPFATGGMLVSAFAFVLLLMLPVNFSYPEFAGILLLLGLSMGAFSSPNRAGRDEQPAARAPRRRGRHEPDLPELGAGALDRDLLHADDPRAVLDDAARALGRAAGARSRCGDRREGRRTCRRSRCCSPRSSATTRRRS